MADVQVPNAEVRLIADGMLKVIDKNLKSWRTKDASAMAYIEVPRGCLLALAECARAYLAQQAEFAAILKMMDEHGPDAVRVDEMTLRRYFQQARDRLRKLVEQPTPATTDRKEE